MFIPDLLITSTLPCASFLCNTVSPSPWITGLQKLTGRKVSSLWSLFEVECGPSLLDLPPSVSTSFPLPSQTGSFEDLSFSFTSCELCPADVSLELLQESEVSLSESFAAKQEDSYTLLYLN
jgi:hypothetical protein